MAIPRIRVRGAGFSITEAIVGMSMFLLVIAGVYLVLETFQVTYWRAEAKADIQQDVRFALERIRRELSMAGYDPSGTGQAGVQNPTSTSVEFIADVDGNNVSDLVKYDRDATARTIRRTVKPWTGTAWGAASVTTVTTNADALTFQYPSTNRIRITITASEQVPTRPSEQHQVTTDVFLRNF